MMRPLILWASVSLLAAACATAPEPPPAAPAPEIVALDSFFVDVEASFVVREAATGRVRVHDPARAEAAMLPASTFKIPHVLIVLETGVIDPDEPLARNPAIAPEEAWWPDAWHESHTLESAFRQSVVWYFQETARRIGEERMQAYLDRFGYGNRDLSGGIDRFWLSGGLRISPLEQVAFMERVLGGELGVSPAATEALRAMMLLEETPTYRLYGKTGSARTDSGMLGWLVGFVEADGAVSVYALNLEGPTVWQAWPPGRRTALVRELLGALEVLPDSL